MVGAADKIAYDALAQGNPQAVIRILDLIRRQGRGTGPVSGPPAGLAGNPRALGKGKPGVYGG